MRPRWWPLALGALVALLLVAVVVEPALAAQPGAGAGERLGDLLRRWGTQLYTGIVAIVAIVFVLNRNMQQLARFLILAMVVGWLVFSPDNVAQTGRQILNGIAG